MIPLTSYYDLPDLIFIITLINHQCQTQQYNSNCTSRTNWLYLARLPWTVFEPVLFDTFQSIKANFIATFEEEPLKVYFWEQSDIPSPASMYWTDSARKLEVRTLTNLCFYNADLSTGDFISGFLRVATWRNPVIVMDITV